jgi:hypothetical protein
MSEDLIRSDSADEYQESPTDSRPKRKHDDCQNLDLICSKSQRFIRFNFRYRVDIQLSTLQDGPFNPTKFVWSKLDIR